MYVCMYVCMYVYVCVCVFMYMCMYVCIIIIIIIIIFIIIIISAHKSDLSNPWSQTQASLSIPSLHPKTQIKEEKERKK